MAGDSLGDRMKNYEHVSRTFLTRRMPAIIRVDGKAFHSFTRKFDRPFDIVMVRSMWETAKYLCANIQGCKLAYVQSDEISLLLTDYDTLTTDAWFGKNLQKMVSVSASMATMAFNQALWDMSFEWKELEYEKYPGDGNKEERIKIGQKYYVYSHQAGSAMFDSRAFILPESEVCNYFVWRQQDATRNAIEAVGQANFSHKELHGVSCNQIQEKLFQEKGINFNDLPVYLKRGACISKGWSVENDVRRSRWFVDENIPVFTQDRNYIEMHL